MDKKEQYKQEFEAKLKVLDAKIDVLKAKAEHASTSAKKDYYETIEDLQEKRSDVEAKLHAFKDAGGEAWEDVKSGLEQSWDTFSSSVKKALSRFDS